MKTTSVEDTPTCAPRASGNGAPMRHKEASATDAPHRKGRNRPPHRGTAQEAARTAAPHREEPPCGRHRGSACVGGTRDETARLCTTHVHVLCTVCCRACVACARCAPLCCASLRVACYAFHSFIHSHTSLVGEPRRLRVRLRGVRERRKSVDVHTVRSRCVYAVVHVVTQFLFARGE